MLPLFKVNMPEGIDQVLKPILESGYISEGPVTKEFETKLQEWMGNPFVATVNSGTAALTIAMRLAGIGPGDEVISSPMTCLAMNEPVLSLGAKVVWCDINPFTGNIDSSKIKDLITSKTKAVLFVDWAGTPAELDAINTVAHAHGLKTIQDCAHALGANYKGKNVACTTDFACFSFQAIKHLTTVDGGAVACSNQEDYDRAVLLRWFGCRRGHNTSPIKWEGDVVEYGYKMHMNDVSAAIGLESLKTIDDKIAKHKHNAAQLRMHLANTPGVELLDIPDYIDSAHWIFTIKLRDSAHRAAVSQKLTAAGIANSIVHTRNDRYSLFKDSATNLPGMDDFGDRMLNIPCGWWLDHMDIYHIVKSVSQFAGE